LRSDCRRQRHIAAAQGLADTHNIRHDLRVFAGKHLARAPESGGDFVKNQHDIKVVAQIAQSAKILRMIKIHAARALHDRFQNKGGNVRMMRFKQGADRLQIRLVPFIIETAFRIIDKITLRQRAAENMVHPRFRIADGHRVPSIAVIPAPHRRNILLRGQTPRLLVLHRHLQRNFHRNRTRIRIKNTVQPLRQNPDQHLAQFHRRLVRQTAEHHMRHLLNLRLNRLIQNRMIVAVYRTPPRRHPVNQPRTVRQFDMHTLRTAHRINRQRIGHGRIGMEQMGAVEIEQGGSVFGQHIF